MIAARTALLRYLPLLLLAAAWELSSRLGLISSLVLPSLSKVIEAWIELIKDGDLITNGLASLYRGGDRKSTRLNSSHMSESRMPSSA